MRRKTLAEMIADYIQEEADTAAAEFDQKRTVAHGRLDPAGATRGDYGPEELTPQALASDERVISALQDLDEFVRTRPASDGRIRALATYNLAHTERCNPEGTWMSGARVHVLLNGFRYRVGDLRTCEQLLTELVQAAREDFR